MVTKPLIKNYFYELALFLTLFYSYCLLYLKQKLIATSEK